jgi:hypothetical protein
MTPKAAPPGATQPETAPSETPPSEDGTFTKLVDEQLELAAAKLPPLASPLARHPSPADHAERKAPHPTLEDVLLGNAEAPPEMADELAALEAASDLQEEELARQALADGGGDGDPSTPE